MPTTPKPPAPRPPGLQGASANEVHFDRDDGAQFAGPARARINAIVRDSASSPLTQALLLHLKSEIEEVLADAWATHKERKLFRGWPEVRVTIDPETKRPIVTCMNEAAVLLVENPEDASTVYE
jgi:hypothetical protein